jgi:hypothetical protein
MKHDPSTVIENYLPYARTLRQQDIIRAYAEHGTPTKAGKALGIATRSVFSTLDTLAGCYAQHSAGAHSKNPNKIPEPYALRGVSTMYNKNGEVALQWVKTAVDREKLTIILTEMVDALKEDVPKAKPVKRAKRQVSTDLLNLYTITDYHYGMSAWGEETGADWDMKIARDTLVEWFELALATAPPAETGVFCNLGDFAHWDGIAAVTPTSGHVLDADTRFRKLIRSMIKSIRKVVDMMLRKYPKVHIIMAEGNHDLASSGWLSEMFSAFYENEPRITVDTRPDPYYAIEHGLTSLFFHHGHKKNFALLEPVFIAKFRELIGRTKYSYAHTGHLHHEKVEQRATMILKQHRTLAAPDSHASRGGFMSDRSASVETYSKKLGRVMINDISFDMLTELKNEKN